MSTEVPRQYDMFTRELVDARTRKQKRQDAKRQQPPQLLMFSQREMAQFGVNPHPTLPLSPKTRLELAVQDPRSEEERAEDLQREIEERTYPMLGEDRDLDAMEG